MFDGVTLLDLFFATISHTGNRIKHFTLRAMLHSNLQR